MKVLSLQEARKEFLDFFATKEHLVMKSFSLIPENDKSLLLINAGMAPLKQYFTKEKSFSKDRVSTSQKCVRTADIENIGKTERHATFFEMLGNFSFGDYFKREAITWAWEFLHGRMEIPKDRIWITVYEEDDEAYHIWHDEVGIDADRILRLGKADNFWELEVGPCGPCSEIHIDRGEQYMADENDVRPDYEKTSRFTEVWNLVFTQFNRQEDGSYTNLPFKNIDTGMGLERLAMISQGADNIFEIDFMKKLMGEIERLSGKKYKTDAKNDISMRIIADHTKAMTFLVSDGVLPSNEGRGYVLRKLIRRAARHGILIGIEDAFLHQLLLQVVEDYSDEYPELRENVDMITRVVLREEEQFKRTIHQGLDILDSFVKDLREKNETTLSGDDAFKLYDTYGFPLDLTREILEDAGLSVDEAAFEKALKEQKERSRAARSEGEAGWSADRKEAFLELEKTMFKGYEVTSCESILTDIVKDEVSVEEAHEGEDVIFVMAATPFYGESGGQVGDTGTIVGPTGKARVTDTKKTKGGSMLHIAHVEEGSFSTADPVKLLIDTGRRHDIMKNHSATHLLHRALRDVLGAHVHQAGSLVTPDHLRFDFTHFEAISKEDLAKIEREVNDAIAKAMPVVTEEMDYEASKSKGAIGLFEDKYQDRVRVVSMGDFSTELCGGTHVHNTAEVQMFKILSEASVASGVRRIEAITGRAVYEMLNDMESRIGSIAEALGTRTDGIEARIDSLKNEMQELKKANEAAKGERAKDLMEDILGEVREVAGVKVVASALSDVDMNAMRDLADRIRDRLGDVVTVFGSKDGDKLIFTASTSKALVKKGVHAGNIIREVTATAGGSGGGRPDMASGGGKDVTKLDEAIEKAYDVVASMIQG